MSERQLLERLAQGPCSGEALAGLLGIGRAAVWKRIAGLRAAGLGISATPGVGYSLDAPLDLLDPERIAAAMPPALRRRLPAPEVAWDIDSTQSALARRTLAEDGACLFAERQRQGRGRHGRPWASPLAANLYFSVLHRFDRPMASLGGLSLVAGVALAEALRARGFDAVGLKWPNDLLAHGRKLGGLLVDLAGESGGPVTAILGVGLNVRMPAGAAAGIDQAWIDLASLGAPGSRSDLAAALLAALWEAMDEFEAAGLAPFLPRWSALDTLAGAEVRLVAGGQMIEGVAQGIAADGSLRLRLADGSERLCHGGELGLRRREAG